MRPRPTTTQPPCPRAAGAHLSILRLSILRVAAAQEGVFLNSSLFSHVFSSKYGKVRIFKIRHVSKKSKEWIADPANKVRPDVHRLAEAIASGERQNQSRVARAHAP